MKKASLFIRVWRDRGAKIGTMKRAAMVFFFLAAVMAAAVPGTGAGADGANLGSPQEVQAGPPRGTRVGVVGDSEKDLDADIAAARAAGLLPQYVTISTKDRSYHFSPYAQVVRTKSELAVRAHHRIYIFPLSEVSIAFPTESTRVDAETLPLVTDLKTGQVSETRAEYQRYLNAWHGKSDPWQVSPNYVQYGSSKLHSDARIGGGSSSVPPPTPTPHPTPTPTPHPTPTPTPHPTPTPTPHPTPTPTPHPTPTPTPVPTPRPPTQTDVSQLTALLPSGSGLALQWVAIVGNYAEVGAWVGGDGLSLLATNTSGHWVEITDDNGFFDGESIVQATGISQTLADEIAGQAERDEIYW